VAHRDRENADAGLLAALAAGLTVEAAAVRAGISPRTAHRRLAEDGFRQRVNAARAEMVQRALGQLAKGSTEAAFTLRKLLRTAPPTVRLGAARSILELGSKLRDAEDVERRLQALEQRLDVKGKQ
jgi:hypothetical protein